jgi:two-component system, OmpR family, sensor kinase
MSTRGRLTLSYAIILFATMLTFAIALWFERKSQAKDELVMQAASTARNMSAAVRAENNKGVGVQLTFLDEAGVVRPTASLIRVLSRYPGYVIVQNNQDSVMYESGPIGDLPRESRDTLISAALRLSRPGVQGAFVSLRNDSLRLFMIADRVGTPTDNVPNVSRIIVGIPTNFAELPGALLVGTMIVIAPIIFLLSVIAAYIVVGAAFRPVDHLINEVEAITDGRSLHRRVATDSSNDELARLSLTVNAMLTRLEGSFAALRRFTADASHELKTPLTVLRADVERAMHPNTNRADRMVALEEALQETARMSDLVNSLLTLARADEGRFDIHREPIELEPLVRDVYETAVILGEDAGLTLSLAALEGGVVMGDETRLRQLLLNLVTNAIKYTPKGGRVEVSVTHRGADEVAITVRDTGIGIATSDLPHVFDRFWRADRVRSRSSERGGFGLGLAIAQWIVQAHGGSISVQSRLGRGSVFTVLLPIAETLPPERQHALLREAEPAVESADS